MNSGADVQDRTGDLVLTKDALCQLSYIGSVKFSVTVARRLERETGIEPATNSLEGCDSTTELLPRIQCSVIGFQFPLPVPAANQPASPRQLTTDH